MKKLIHIFGASGSGVSTLSMALAKKYNYFYIDIDDIFWINTNPPFMIKNPVECRLIMLEEIFNQEDYIIIGGSFSSWGDSFINRLSLAIRTTIDPALRMKRLLKREKERYPSLIEGTRQYDEHQKFIEYARSYETADKSIRSKTMHDEWQKLLKCPVITIDTSKPIDDLVISLESYFDK